MNFQKATEHKTSQQDENEARSSLYTMMRTLSNCGNSESEKVRLSLYLVSIDRAKLWVPPASETIDCSFQLGLLLVSDNTTFVSMSVVVYHAHKIVDLKGCFHCKNVW